MRIFPTGEGNTESEKGGVPMTETDRTESRLSFCADYRENVRRVDRYLRLGQSFDLIKKVLTVGAGELTLYYIDGFVDGGSMNKLMGYFLNQSLTESAPDGTDAAARAFCRGHLPFVEADVTDDADLAAEMLLSGATLLFGSPFGRYAIVIDSRSYPARSVAEPESDRVMLGSRDGFVETLIRNTALIRRRIRTPDLVIRHFSIGTRSRTDVALCFVDGQADAAYVSLLTEKLNAIRTGALSLGHESLAELLIRKKWYNPFPKIRYTERPDVACAQLLEGSVLILCDNSPDAMILPSSFFDFMQESNDFYFPPLIGTYIRFIRHLIFWSTLFLVPTWFLFTQNPALVPDWLSFALPRGEARIPIFVQLILVEFMIDGLRLASMNTPDMLSNSLSIVGGLILGDFAVEIGWLLPEVILYMAFVAIANFTQRSYELGYAFKLLRLLLLLLTELWNFVGFGVGLGIIALLLLTNITVGEKRPYLYPLIPFHGKALLSLFFRLPKDTFGKRGTAAGSGRETGGNGDEKEKGAGAS